MENNKNNGKGIIEAILALVGGYSLIGTLTSEPTLSLFNSSSEGTGESVSSTFADPTMSTACGIGGTALLGGVLTAGVSSGSSEKEIGRVNGHRIYENGLGEIFTSNQVNNYIMDEKAREAYNKYHKGNEKEMNDGTIVLMTPEAVRAFNEMMSSMSKKELYYRVCALLEILEEDKQKEDEKKLRLK